MINEINHSIFGNIKYDYGCINDKEIYYFGKNRTIQIVVEADKDVEFESSQEDAYKSFFTNVDILLAKAEEEVYEYYQKVCLDYRERLSDDLKDKIAPLVKFKKGVIKLVKPKQILFPMVFDMNIREVGIVLDCTWEE